MKPVTPADGKTSFLLVKLSDHEQANRLVKSLKPLESNAFTTGKKNPILM